jgi:hypothetical protein
VLRMSRAIEEIEHIVVECHGVETSGVPASVDTE